MCKKESIKKKNRKRKTDEGEEMRAKTREEELGKQVINQTCSATVTS